MLFRLPDVFCCRCPNKGVPPSLTTTWRRMVRFSYTAAALDRFASSTLQRYTLEYTFLFHFSTFQGNQGNKLKLLQC